MTSQFLKSERLYDVVKRIFTPSVILQIYEESLKEKKAKESVGAADRDNNKSLMGAWRKNMRSNHNLDLSGVNTAINDQKVGGLTNDMLKNVQNPNVLHNKILNNILNASKINFDNN